MGLEKPQHDQQGDTPPAQFEQSPEVSNRFLFVDIAALRAKQLRRGARPRLDSTVHDGHPQPHKAERVAMEEVRRRLVQFDLPPNKPPVANIETGL